MDFPRTVEEITPEWLTRVLRESRAIQDATVESFTATGLDGGLVGDVNRLKLVYADSVNNCPETLIVKLANSDDGMRSIFTQNGMYEREVRFYQELANEAGIPMSSVYHSEFDRDSGYFVLLMEDLGRYRPVTVTEDCSFEDGNSAIQALAKMHAKWWDADHLNGFDWLGRFTNIEELNRRTKNYPNVQERFLEISDRYLPVGYESVARKFGQYYREIFEDFGKNPVTLLHGDFRPVNLLFNDEVGTSNPVYAFDWQLASSGKAATDVAYFICWSFAPASRRRFEDRLLTNYHDTLTECGVDDYSYQEFSVDVRLGAFKFMQTVTNATVDIARHLPETEAGTQRLKTICGRLQLILDWNCDEVIPK